MSNAVMRASKGKENQPMDLATPRSMVPCSEPPQRAGLGGPGNSKDGMKSE